MIFDKRRILVTGGTGSLGQTLVRRILSGSHGTPKKVIVLSRDEAKQHDMRMSYLHKLVATDEVIYNNFKNTLEFRIGDVRSYADVCGAVRDVDTVINAAALKQVPACEYFPEQALLTNCMGAANIVRAIQDQRYAVDTVVGVSTDKACKPINVMGLTKAIQERIFISGNILNSETRFICVRYGNVLASRGSVIPLFHNQIRCGGPVTITTPQMTRFLLSLEQAVDTVIAAIRDARPGEIFVPNAPSATIVNVAQALIGDRKIDVKFTGIRPGEKTHEIMVSDEEAFHCIKSTQYYSIRPMLPELCQTETSAPVLTKEFSSADNVLSLDETVELLRRHHLMIDQVEPKSDRELLR
jgi:FlaA1/EpsC-like NDP-sugar epimerase